MTTDEFLEHHGIKGQRWGIRRTPEQLGHKVRKLRRKNTRLEEKNIKTEQKKLKADRMANKKYQTALRKAAVNDMDTANKYYQMAASWTARSQDYQRAIAKAKQQIFDNEQLARSFERTIDAIESGKIKNGQTFLERFFMRYEGSED